MLTLATRLRALDDAALQRAISVREVAAAGIRDFFDLAEALLEPDAIQRALARLDRVTLAVLAAAGELTEGSGTAPDRRPAATLAELADRLSAPHRPVTTSDVKKRAAEIDDLMLARLVDDRLTPYEAVSAQLRSWPQHGLPSAAELAEAPSPAEHGAPSGADIEFTDRMAAERAFATVSSVTELVNELSREPARELSRGGLGLPDTKRLAASMDVEPHAVAPLMTIATRADLIARDAGYWMETETGQAWLLEGTARRWAALAEAWYAALPPDVRGILPHAAGVSWGRHLHAFVAWLYPAGGQQMDERVTRFARGAELIGITASEATSQTGALLLAGDLALATATMAESLPAEVGTVYLQHDLSIVAPGPLAPSIDTRIRGIADVESRELASSYRITAASVNRGLAAGESADSLLEFLRGISLTGIPQPLDYLIRESAERYGRVRVGNAEPAEAPAQSYVRSEDAALLGTILVDQTLAPLALRRVDDHRLTSRFAADVAFWTLSDARYPVAAEDTTGQIIHLLRHQLTRPEETSAPDPAIALVEKLRSGDAGEGKAAGAWLARQLDAAIKSRQTVTVSIAMPGGKVVDYLLEPASMGGGRFRARDRRADIERTLPLSSIISITPGS